MGNYKDTRSKVYEFADDSLEYFGNCEGCALLYETLGNYKDAKKKAEICENWSDMQGTWYCSEIGIGGSYINIERDQIDNYYLTSHNEKKEKYTFGSELSYVSCDFTNIFTDGTYYFVYENDRIYVFSSDCKKYLLKNGFDEDYLSKNNCDWYTFNRR